MLAGPFGSALVADGRGGLHGVSDSGLSGIAHRGRRVFTVISGVGRCLGSVRSVAGTANFKLNGGYLWLVRAIPLEEGHLFCELQSCGTIPVDGSEGSPAQG